MKSKEEILEQSYLSAKDLKQLMPAIGIHTCRNIISEVQYEMEKKGYYIPNSKAKLALTKFVVKKLGL